MLLGSIELSSLALEKVRGTQGDPLSCSSARGQAPSLQGTGWQEEGLFGPRDLRAELRPHQKWAVGKMSRFLLSKT